MMSVKYITIYTTRHTLVFDVKYESVIYRARNKMFFHIIAYQCHYRHLSPMYPYQQLRLLCPL